MNQFSTRLTKLKGKPTRNRIEAEEEARIAFEQDIEKIRSQRRLFRSMKHDAIKERQRLLDSLALQKEDEELLRQKVKKSYEILFFLNFFSESSSITDGFLLVLSSISLFPFSFSKSRRFLMKSLWKVTAERCSNRWDSF